MFINKTNTIIVVGRFKILPNDKVPATALTVQETADVLRLVKKGLLVDTGEKLKPTPSKIKKAADRPAKVETQVQEEPQPEAPAPETTPEQPVE